MLIQQTAPGRTKETHPPPRFLHPPLWQYLLFMLFGAFLLVSLDGSGLTRLSWRDVVAMPGQVLYVLDQMFPPSLERLETVGWAMLQTLEMALIGNLVGIPVSLGLAVFCARNLTPHPVVYAVTRLIVTFLRTTPSLVWAIFLIVAVGLGPRAGTVTLILATIGFCGRFFAEAMEEVDPGPREALTAMGASRGGSIVCAVIPAAMPAFINTALFNLEHTTRSSAVLGIVGAGGIGFELMAALRLLAYDQVSAILLAILACVVLVDGLGAVLRKALK
jgi:phosphonate transport system permease protein